MTSPARFLLFVVLVIVGIKGSEQLYSYVAYRDERALVRTLRTDLQQTATELIATRARSDSLSATVSDEDRRLTADLKSLQRFYRMARGGALTPEVYAQWNEERTRYNLRVDERNASLREWQEIDGRHRSLAMRYNLLADSIHGIAARMGEPYYQVPSALEAAQEAARPEP
ncbi:hypothetical protein [Longimicrobium terrae]|uniref:Uncharacterized protein n=1 Tax=Longimicrobium terrae TaxID=1639882 RepID=A0A841H2E5_9BACT|nr:hypothetical protein [Longimicrobium terrae]MBB4637923.1 hypothetical protein [Longimicrobium terrae]MBB6072170.1 hypothetical protein [Longimicrobium terrae]NNC28403.1 hypothetical protein [Longimicrobium terrae]